MIILYFYNLQNGSGGDDYIVQQFTGVKDINGIDIYEGDKLHYKYDGGTYPKEEVDKFLYCVYDAENAWFSFQEENEPDDSYNGYYWMEIENNCKVIGTIFDKDL